MMDVGIADTLILNDVCFFLYVIIFEAVKILQYLTLVMVSSSKLDVHCWIKANNFPYFSQ